MISHPPHVAPVLRPNTSPCLFGNEAMNGPVESAIILSGMSNVSPVGRNQGGVVVTLPTAPVPPELSSSRTVPVKNAVETPVGVSGSPKGAQVGATQGDLIITLPAAMTPELNSCSSGHITVNQTVQIVASNVEPAPPRGSNLIITLQPPPVPNTLICPTPIIKTKAPLAKDHISQRCGTLLRLIPRDSGGLAQVYQKPLNRFLLLPPGYVFAGSSFGHQTLKHSSALNSTEVKHSKQQRTPANFHSAHGPQRGPPQMPSIQDTSTEYLQETTSAEELNNDDDDDGVENEVEECGEKDSRELFLTLSESSGSPTPSIDREDTDIQMVLDRRGKLEEQKAKERQGSSRQTGEEEADGANNILDVSSVPEFQVRSFFMILMN